MNSWSYLEVALQAPNHPNIIPLLYPNGSLPPLNSSIRFFQSPSLSPSAALFLGVARNASVVSHWYMTGYVETYGQMSTNV